MSVALDFVAAAETMYSRDPLPELLPVALSRAATRVLGCAGAGLGFLTDPAKRWPIGASDEHAVTAERVEFTLGHGPSLQAFATRRAIVAGPNELTRHWPVLLDELAAQTPFRGVVSVPLGTGPSGLGTFDLYFTDPCGAESLFLPDAQIIALYAESLLQQHVSESSSSGPLWLDGPVARSRDLVWLAVGMVRARFQLSADDALALLRSHAYAEGLVLDDLAGEIVTRRLPVDQLMPFEEL